MHPHLVQQTLVDYCNAKGIHITAYSATGKISLRNHVRFLSDILIGHGSVREEAMLKSLSVKYDSSVVQVILAWHVARGVSVATKSSDPDRRKEALKAGSIYFPFTLRTLTGLCSSRLSVKLTSNKSRLLIGIRWHTTFLTATELCMDGL
jgi:diketogulonate reductase-like aldo/keto reductase